MQITKEVRKKIVIRDDSTDLWLDSDNSGDAIFINKNGHVMIDNQDIDMLIKMLQAYKKVLEEK